jgi:hypothetical protein
MNEKLTRPSSDGKSLVDRQGKIGAVARLNGYEKCMKLTPSR